LTTLREEFGASYGGGVQMDVLRTDAVVAIAALGDRALLDPPTVGELTKAFDPADQPAVWIGDPAVGVVGFTRTGDAGFLRFLAVAPEARGAGVGRALVARAETELRAVGARTVTTGADAPYYLWPGIDTRELGAVCLFERLKYARVETNFNMDVDLDALPADPGGWRVANAADRDAVDAWAGTHWSWWRAEMLRAVDQDGLVLSEDADGIAAVCATAVNRDRLVGPVAVRPDRLGQGIGVAPLLGALHRMRAAGHRHVEVAWVGPVVPYARIGATIGRTFFVARKELR
jgi:predicted N-acetyltransferase YhbS